MNYFTPERYHALQNFDEAAMNAADADWEEAAERYNAYLDTILPELPEPVRQLLQGFYLHDANVLSMGQREDVFVIVLQLDVPPHDLLTITYTLAEPPLILQGVLPPEDCSPQPGWMHEELEMVCNGTDKTYLHSVLLSNGWELRLAFREVKMATAYPYYPLRGARQPASVPARTSQSA